METKVERFRNERTEGWCVRITVETAFADGPSEPLSVLFSRMDPQEALTLATILTKTYVGQVSYPGPEESDA